MISLVSGAVGSIIGGFKSTLAEGIQEGECVLDGTSDGKPDGSLDGTFERFLNGSSDGNIDCLLEGKP